MKKLAVSHDKSLRLTNVLKREVSEQERGNDNLIIVIEQMNNYIKSKGYQQVGPLIQHTKVQIEKDGNACVYVELMLQASNFINHVEYPYKCEPVMRIKNCMYVRYTGPENMLKFAYDKINLTAFEEDIKLKGDSYTVFVNQVDDDIIADVFMERAEDA